VSQVSAAHTGPRLRAALDAVPRYRAGAAAPSEADAVGADRGYKVASNENPFPPLPGVQAAIADAAAGVNRYPDFGAEALLQLLSNHVGDDVDQDRIALGTGSVALLQHALEITCDDGGEVVYAWRSFEAYPILVRIVGAVPVEVPLDAEHCHDIKAMIAAVSPATRVVILCSPNNPTGTALSREQVITVLTETPSDVLVVLDEAYVEFVDEEQGIDAVALIEDYPNLCILRTFSKAYGLAGLRLGYAIASPRVAEALRAVATPFGISAPAQAAGCAVLAPAAAQELDRRIAHLTRERARVGAALGVAIASNPQGNFIWLPIGERAVAFDALCRANGLSVRLFPREGVRVTIAETPANDRLIALWLEFDRS